MDINLRYFCAFVFRTGHITREMGEAILSFRDAVPEKYKESFRMICAKNPKELNLQQVKKLHDFIIQKKEVADLYKELRGEYPCYIYHKDVKKLCQVTDLDFAFGKLIAYGLKRFEIYTVQDLTNYVDLFGIDSISRFKLGDRKTGIVKKKLEDGTLHNWSYD